MAGIDSLTDQQRAILQLLLKQGRSYGEIEALLKLEAGAVQARAHEAIIALEPDRPEIGEARRREIADYLLGQQPAPVLAATLEYLGDSAAGRRWAREVSGSLRPLAAGELPEVPAEPARAKPPPITAGAGKPQSGRGNQLSTTILFVALGLGVVIILILVIANLGGGGDDTKTATVTRTAPADGPQTISQGTLAPPAGAKSDASAQAGIIRYRKTNNFKLLVAAKNVQPPPTGSSYGVWLYSSKADKQFLGFPQASVSEDGELDVVADLTPDTPNFKEVLITRETAENPSAPGEIVLRGKLVPQEPADSGKTQSQPGTQTQTQPG